MAEVLIVAENADVLGGLIGAEAFEEAGAVPPDARQAEVLLADPPAAAAIAPAMPRLRWIQSTWAGVDALLRTGVPPGVVLTAMKDVFGPQMREFVFGHLLAFTQGVVRRTLSTTWDQRPPPLLAGSRLGILATGSIGSALAAAGRHFGMEVVGCSRSGVIVDGFSAVYSTAEIDEFATDLDHLVAVLPATASTKNLVGADVIDQMRLGGCLVNVGRGDTVVVEAVVEALRSGRLAHAVLDVLPNEPLPDGDPLWHEPNLVLTSHTAAWSRPEDVAAFFLANLERHRHGQPLVGVVDLARGY